MIHLENISKHYKKNDDTITALADISLHIPRSSLTLVCGPSGSGKTTLINLIAGLTRPSHGTIHLDDDDITHLSGNAYTRLRARKIALVFQMFHLVPYLNALENVLLPTLALSPAEDAKVRALHLLESLGLEERINHFPAELSAGERQRCALARALMNRPQVILADEPTGNLDEESAGLVLEQLARARKEGAAILLVSHQHLHQISADQTLTLKQGRLC